MSLRIEQVPLLVFLAVFHSPVPGQLLMAGYMTTSVPGREKTNTLAIGRVVSILNSDGLRPSERKYTAGAWHRRRAPTFR